MSADIDRTLERVRQNFGARREVLREAATPASLAQRLGGRQYLAGDRVLDTVTGEHGDVVAVTDTITPGAGVVSVRFPDGGLVTRSPDQLILRPTPASSRA